MTTLAPPPETAPIAVHPKDADLLARIDALLAEFDTQQRLTALFQSIRASRT